MTTTATPTWLTAKQLSERLSIPVSTLTTWRQTGAGPRFARFGSSIRYREDHVVEWEDAALTR